MSECTVSVLMPAYNAEKYIVDAVQSILQQRFSFFELLIVDDGSEDGTPELIAGMHDERIRYFRRPHLGVSASLNFGLQQARGKYVARFDADDIAHYLRLGTQLEFLEQNPGYVLVGSAAEYLLEDGNHLFDFNCIAYNHEEIVSVIRHACPFIHSSVMYRKDAVIKAGGYSLYAHNFEDYLLWVRLLPFGRFCNLHEKLVQVRFNPSSVTIDEKWRGRRFRDIKRQVILRGDITAEEGRELGGLLASQDYSAVKNGAYHALCAKKFLVNNYRPADARRHIFQSIRCHPLRADNYALLLSTFLPRKWLRWLHQLPGAQTNTIC